ncbi:MAG: hypothetical protein HOI47_29225 [Candidatus Scalindua sp.]|jgi:hypothetical protein|nr:hypothetical protein [Candidatus Scalindua sp.]
MKVDIILNIERIAYNKKFKIVGKVHQVDMKNDEKIKTVLFLAYKKLEKDIESTIETYRKAGGLHYDRN